MIKIFDTGKNWDTKVNFVDEHNVLVGYDTQDSCCEHADWFISYNPCAKIVEETNAIGASDDTDELLLTYMFDKDYMDEREEDGNEDPCNDEYRNIVTFKLISVTGEPLYLHLFNVHNGYYSHGFTYEGFVDAIGSGSGSL